LFENPSIGRNYAAQHGTDWLIGPVRNGQYELRPVSADVGR
jgi:hypothetical protein